MGRRYAEVLPDGIVFAPLKDKSMASWIRFEQPVATGRERHLDEVQLLACGCGPC